MLEHSTRLHMIIHYVFYTYAQILLCLSLPILINDEIVDGIKQNTICTDMNKNICNG